MSPSKLITDELFAMLNECYKLSTNKCLKCDLVQKNFNKKSAVISNRTLIDYFAFEPSNSKEGFLSEFTQMICAAA